MLSISALLIHSIEIEGVYLGFHLCTRYSLQCQWRIHRGAAARHRRGPLPAHHPGPVHAPTPVQTPGPAPVLSPPALDPFLARALYLPLLLLLVAPTLGAAAPRLNAIRGEFTFFHFLIVSTRLGILNEYWLIFFNSVVYLLFNLNSLYSNKFKCKNWCFSYTHTHTHARAPIYI